MFGYTSEGLKTFYKFKKRKENNESYFPTNKISCKNMNIQTNNFVKKYNFPINWDYGDQYLFSSNNNLNKKFKSLNNSSQNSLNSPRVNNNLSVNNNFYLNGKTNNILFTRNKTYDNFKKKKPKNYTSFKEKNLIPSLLDYSQFNKTFFNTNSLENYKISNYKPNSERSVLFKNNSIGNEKNVIRKSNMNRINNKFRLKKKVFFENHKLFSSINKMKNSSRFINSFIDKKKMTNKNNEKEKDNTQILNNKDNNEIIDNEQEKDNNQIIDLSHVKFTNNLIKKFINKKKTKNINLYIKNKE